MDIGHVIRTAINGGQDIHNESDWSTENYTYSFRKVTSSGYALVAGCRTFSTFAAFRAHYHDRHWIGHGVAHYGIRSARRHREAALRILDDMQEFAKKYAIPMCECEPPEPKRKSAPRRRGKLPKGNVRKKR